MQGQLTASGGVLLAGAQGSTTGASRQICTARTAGPGGPLRVLAGLVALGSIDAKEADASAARERERIAIGNACGHARKHRPVTLLQEGEQERRRSGGQVERLARPNQHAAGSSSRLTRQQDQQPACRNLARRTTRLRCGRRCRQQQNQGRGATCPLQAGVLASHEAVVQPPEALACRSSCPQSSCGTAATRQRVGQLRKAAPAAGAGGAAAVRAGAASASRQHPPVHPQLTVRQCSSQGATGHTPASSRAASPARCHRATNERSVAAQVSERHADSCRPCWAPWQRAPAGRGRHEGRTPRQPHQLVRSQLPDTVTRAASPLGAPRRTRLSSEAPSEPL